MFSSINIVAVLFVPTMYHMVIASLWLVAACESKPLGPKAIAVPVKLQTLTSATLIDSSEYIGIL